MSKSGFTCVGLFQNNGIHFNCWVAFWSLTFTVVFTNFLPAQQEFENPKKVVIIDFGMNLGINTGVFKENISHKTFGLHSGVYFQRNPYDPYAYGAHLFYNQLGSYHVNFIDQAAGGIELREVISSHVLGLMAAFRLYPGWDIGKMKMYIHLLFGPKILYTTQSLFDLNREFIDEFDFIHGSVSLSYGGGVGINYPLLKWLQINARWDFIPGISASYYRKLDEIPVTDFAIDGFEKKNSATDMMNFSLGISFFF